MLQALIAYAEREGLGDLDFEHINVRWLVDITADGQLKGQPICLDEPIPGGQRLKPKRVFRPRSDPDFVAHGRSYFLCDSLERSALWVEDETRLATRRINQTYFLSLLAEAAKACTENAKKFAALTKFLSDQTQLEKLHLLLKASKAKTSDNALYAVEGTVLIEIDEVKKWWRSKNHELRVSRENNGAMCLVTAQVGPVCRTTGFIKLQGEDTKLISFNKECPAFESFGLSQAANAPVSIIAEEKFRSSLNRLIENSRADGLTFANTSFLHWTREEMAIPDPMEHLLSADPEAIASLLHSVKHGSKYMDLEANYYYCMSLSGNGARIVIRDWLELTVPEVAKNIADWFEDLSIIDPNGVETKRAFKFGALLFGMVRDKIEELPPALAAQLFHCSFRGRSYPLPKTALAAALRRQQLDQEDKLKPARLAIIKACLNRSTEPNPTPMTEALNPESQDTAYLCGRLFAAFDRLQYLALGSVNAGVVERFYASASTTPSLVMGRLFRNAQFHLAKANEGAAENVRKDFEGLSTALGNTFPSSLSLEQQGRFALGYYHQKAEYRRRSAENKVVREEAEAAKLIN